MTILPATIAAALAVTLAQWSLLAPAEAPQGAGSKASTSGAAATAPAAGTATASVKAPTVYIFPLEGQLLTDVHENYIADIIADIRATKPDFVILRMKMADVDKIWYLTNDDPKEFSLFDRDRIRAMSTALKRDLAGPEAVMWVQDCVGWSFALAFGFENLYMSDDARLWGPPKEMIERLAQHPDQEVQRKYRAAMDGIVQGFSIAGGYDQVMAAAFLKPELVCSVDFKGRDELSWRPDASGIYVLDSNDKDVLRLSSDTAGEVGIADGIVSADPATGLRELLFDRGVGEFVTVGNGEKIFREYKEGWREALDKARELWESQRQDEERDPMRELNRKIGILDQLLSIVRRFPAVETRLGSEDVDVQIKIRKERLEEDRKRLRREQEESGRDGGGSSGRNGRGVRGGGLAP